MKLLKNHPLYYWTKFRESIKFFLFPCQRWLWKKLKGPWKDLDQIFEITVLEGIKFYVEKDLTLERLNDEMARDLSARQKRFNKELKYIYKLTTVNLPKLEKDLKKLWKELPKFRVSEFNDSRPSCYFEQLKEIDKLESKIRNLKSKILIWAVQNRGSMWC